MRLTLALLAFTLAAQELDTANFGRGNSVSLLDRAESVAERRAFEDLQRTSEPRRRREAADAFVATYAKSWLLVSIYQIAAAASLELKDYSRVLIDGRRALRLLPENAPLLLTLARIEQALGDAKQARLDAADALLWLSVMAAPAHVKQKDWIELRRDLEQQAMSITGRDAVATKISRTRPEKFAGSEVCAECHTRVYQSWKKSGMAAMLTPRSEATVLADFAELREFRDATGRVLARTGGGMRPFFEFAAPGSVWKRFPVDFTIGSRWQQAYATRTADDRIFVFPIQYSAVQKQWVNYWSMIDPPGSERSRVEQFPSLTEVTNYQRNCAVCHTSQLRLTRLDDSTLQRASFREPGVNCEMCHGPSASHAAAMKSGKPETTSDANRPPFRFGRLDPREATLICGQCHRQSATRELGSNGEMNYTANAPFYLRTLSRPYLEFGTRAFYKDGRFRETTFIGEAFMRSACFRRGGAQCASCHDPHPADAGENRVSLKFRSDPDRMCLQCHASIGARITQHTRHAAASAGSRCVGCHMPRIMNSLLFQAASHQIDDIPRADFTSRFGQQDSPNACLLCHEERDAAWVEARLRQ